MTCLQTLREHYLAVRRSLGAKLSMTDWLLRQFIAFLAQREAMFITTALALDWATEPEGVQMAWRAPPVGSPSVRSLRPLGRSAPRSPASTALALSAPTPPALHIQ